MIEHYEADVTNSPDVDKLAKSMRDKEDNAKSNRERWKPDKDRERNASLKRNKKKTLK
jgi:hypothetical protein